MLALTKRLSALVLAFLASTVVYGAVPAKATETPFENSLHAVHNALFASFLPIDELPDDPHTAALLRTVRDGMWEQAGNQPAMQQLLAPFVDLRRFGSACGIAGIEDTAANSFAALSIDRQHQVLSLLRDCNRNDYRRLAATIRNFYLVNGYGAIQYELAGVKLNLFAPPAYLRSHTPPLPPTRVRYDKVKREVVEKDGKPIDVLIVGSGPAGSVLAHELRRNGKRVLLIERGSFVVPGSMETRLIDDLIDTRTTVDGSIWIRNGMAVGGGSQVNVDLCFAPTSEAIRRRIDVWRKAGQITPDQFTPSEVKREYDWVKRMIGTRSVSKEEINLNNRVLWDGAKLDGLHPKLYGLNTYPPGRSPSPVTDKRSAESQLLVGALEDYSNPLSMIPDADVRRVLFERTGGNMRAVGVEVQMRPTIPEGGAIADPNHLRLLPGETFVVHAKTVILSAGALGSPIILLRSGLKNDQIGRGLILHPSMPIMGRFDHPIDALNGTEASVYVDDHLSDRGYAMESMSALPLYAAPARRSTLTG